MPRFVQAPEALAGLFETAERYVKDYFGAIRFRPEQGSIEVQDQRYALVRAGSLSVGFFDVVCGMYPEEERAEAVSMARSLLYDLAHGMGLADAREFSARMGVRSPLERLSAGPVHFAFAGWASVHLREGSAPSPDEDFLLVYDHPYSFESHSWLAAERETDLPVCVMNAGYSSGWCEASFELPLVAVELSCRARGDEHCRFLMAPPERIDARIASFRADHPEMPAVGGVEVPGFLRRQRAAAGIAASERELRRLNEELELRVQARTVELVAVNERLERELQERELAELQRRRLEEKVRETQRLESLGVLAGGVAHDFNNLLATMLGNAQLLRRRLTRHTRAGLGAAEDAANADLNAQFLDQIETAAQRAAELTKQMLVYAGRAQPSVARMHLPGLVSEMLQLISASVPKSVQLDVQLDESVPEVLADAGQMRQVVMNLILNAAESIEGRGHVRVGVQRETLDADDIARLRASGDATPGTFVSLSVRDTGAGMDDETLSKIFEPFFTTKFTGRGLGLAALMGIVRGHQGGVQIETQVGKGSCFTVYLPAALDDAVEPPVTRPPSEDTVPGVALLVDDEAEVNAMLGSMLEVFAMSVKSVPSGEEALAYLAQHGAPAVILLDMTMPGLSGVEVLRALRQTEPTLPVLLMSGYGLVGEEGAALEGPHTGFLQKPFTLESLRNALLDLLT